jgi:Domain of unknown function (DUF6265)
MFRLVTLAVLAVVWFPALSEAQSPAPAEAAVESPSPNTIRLKPDAPRPAATLDVLAWLAGGTWRGDGLGGETEESWSTPAAGAMMGMFRLVKPGADGRKGIGFYEFLTFVEQQGSLVLKLKHFNADLTGWEEKDGFVTFRLARVTTDVIYFDGLTFQKEGRDKMTIFLALRDRATNTVSEATFKYTRQ